MIYTLSDFVQEFRNICDMGWITTHRAGPTGIGKTLEDLLGIQENNIDGPDFGDYELKSCRLNSNSMLTIFTKTPQPQGAVNTLRMTFGYSSDAYDNNEKVLHSTLSADRPVPIANTGHTLVIVCGPTKISIVAEDGIEYAYWTRDQLKKAFEKYKEVKDKNDADKVIGYTYSVVKWNLSDSDIAKLNVEGSFSPKHMAALADDYLQFYFLHYR